MPTQKPRGIKRSISNCEQLEADMPPTQVNYMQSFWQKVSIVTENNNQFKIGNKYH